MQPFTLPKETHIGSVHLRVSDLKNALVFYQDLLGFNVLDHSNDKASLSADGNPPAQILLVSHPTAKPKEQHTTGLYHVAIRVPTRLALGRLLNRLIERQWPLYGGSDHLVSEALYLADQDGNGIELYADKPSETWPIIKGLVQMASEPLDFRALIKEAKEDSSVWNGIHPATDIGHIHLQVSDLQQSERFYNQVLGLEVTQRNYPGALFLAAGGYHHHVGLNIWNSRGARPSSPDHAGLIAFEIRIPDEQSRQILMMRFREADFAVEDSRSVDQSNQIMVTDPDSIQLII